MVRKKSNNTALKVFLIIVIIFVFIGLFFAFLGWIFGGNEWSGYGNAAVIPIKGVITVDGGDSLMSDYTSADYIIDKIKEADEDSTVDAIVLEINSPGGGAVASNEIGDAIKKVNKTTVAWIREVGASGGYWIASSCDIVVAHRMSITGSIGVIASYLEFSGLLDEYNITYQRMVSGKYKDMGSPMKEMTPEEEEIFQKQLDEIHDIFIEEVAVNRNLSIETVEEFATGEIILGGKAKELGLVDILGSEDEVKKVLEDSLNKSVSFKRIREHVSILGLLSESISDNFFLMGKGIGSALKGEERVIIKT